MKELRLLPLALVLAMVGAGFTVGCKHHIPHSVSTGGPLIKDVKVIGRVEGESSASFFLFGLIGPVGDDTLKAAVQDALSKKGGDSLINMTVDRAVTQVVPRFPLVLTIRTKVSGLAVQYTN